jgi:hypothetical protein
LTSLFIYFLNSTASDQLQIQHVTAAAAVTTTITATTNLMHKNKQENTGIL